MRRITVPNYRRDKHYRRVVDGRWVLERTDVVIPVEVFVAMGLLDAVAAAEWRAGRIDFLERAVRCNLAVASRILRILRLHTHDLNLRPIAHGIPASNPALPNGAALHKDARSQSGVVVCSTLRPATLDAKQSAA